MRLKLEFVIFSLEWKSYIWMYPISNQFEYLGILDRSYLSCNRFVISWYN